MTVDTIAVWWRGMRSSESLQYRLARGTAWTIVGTVMQQLCAVLASIGAARILGKIGFGELGITRSTMATFGVLAGSGLGLATTRYVAELRTANPARAGTIIGLFFRVAAISSGAGSLLCILASQPLAKHALHAPALAWPLALSGLLVLFNTIGGVQLGVLTGLESFRLAAFAIAFDGCATASGILLGARYAAVIGAIAGSVIASALSMLLRQWLMSTECRRASLAIGRGGFRTELPILWSFIVPSILLGVSTQPFEWLGRVLLTRQPNGLAEVGVLTAAYSWGQIVLFIPTQVTGPALPILTNILGMRNMSAFRRLLRHTLLLAIASGVATALVMVLASKWIMRAYGKEFVQGWLILSIFAGAYAIASLSSVFRAALLASGHAWVQNGQALIWGAALLLAFLALRELGSLGLAAAYAIAFGVVVVTQSLETL